DNDAFLLDSGLDVTVLRPGLVAGIGSVGFDTLLAVAGRTLTTVHGSGLQRWSYIAVDDLVGYLVDALDEIATYRRAFDVGSTEAPTYRELLSRTAAVLGRPGPRIVPIPLPLLRTLAPLVEHRHHLPRGGIRAALDHLADDLTGDPTTIRTTLPRTLLTWETAVRRST
ncbi:MAG TPA: hypothetical protein VMV41_16345, partial [Cellulomonadaceae bacterium]|nr:hypothetical protein [Cellulomonadaceae bacterium]